MEDRLTCIQEVTGSNPVRSIYDLFHYYKLKTEGEQKDNVFSNIPNNWRKFREYFQIWCNILRYSNNDNDISIHFDIFKRRITDFNS